MNQAVVRPNCIQLDSKIFIVRTQAGYRKAVKLVKKGRELSLQGVFSCCVSSSSIFHDRQL